MPRAAIDIGSNSILLTVLAEDDTVLHDEARVVGLGRGLGDRGSFAPDRIVAASEVIADYARIAKGYGIDPLAVHAVATSAARRAMNAQTVFERFQRNHGVRVRIISGAEEARLTWLGAQRDLHVVPGPQLVIDLGGGSTELVLADESGIIRRSSLELGSARLTERFVPPSDDGRVDPARMEPLRAYIDAELARWPFEGRPTVVIGVAGTVTTIAAMHAGLSEYDADRVHGSELPAQALARIGTEWPGLTRADRVAKVPFAPKRADFLLAGATVLERVLFHAGHAHLTVSDRGLRFGVLAEG